MGINLTNFLSSKLKNKKMIDFQGNHPGCVSGTIALPPPSSAPVPTACSRRAVHCTALQIPRTRTRTRAQHSTAQHTLQPACCQAPWQRSASPASVRSRPPRILSALPAHPQPPPPPVRAVNTAAARARAVLPSRNTFCGWR